MALDLGSLSLRLTAKDETAKGLGSAKRGAQQFAADATKSGRKAGEGLGDGFSGGLLARARAAVSRYAQVGREAGDNLSSGLKEKLGDGQGAILSLAGKAGLGLLAVNAVKAGVETAAGMETARMGFTTMLGSAKAADTFLKQLADFAAKTPFEFPELQTAAQSLISAGVQADKVIPIMRTLGDVTAGMGTGAEGVQRATVAIQQMNAAGRITAEDLNQLRDAGIPVYDLLAAATGRSKQEVAGLAQAGKLGKTELDAMMKALETGAGLERFNGLMQQTSTSLSGLWSTLQDTFSQGMAQAIAPAIPLIKAGLGGAIAFASDHLDEAIQVGLAFFAVWSVQKVGTLVGSLAEMTSGFARLSAGLGSTASFLGGPWGIAVGLGVAAIGLLIAKQEMAAQQTKAFTDQLTFQKGALDENSKQMIVKRLAEEGMLEAAKNAGVAEKDYVIALLAGGKAREDMIDKLTRTGIAARAAVDAHQGDIVAQEGVANSAFDAADKLKLLGGGLDASRAAADLAASASDGLAASQKNTGDVTMQLKAAQSDLEVKTKTLQTETQKLIDKFTILRDGALSAEQANTSFEAALDAVDASVKENGRSLDSHSEKGRNNRATIVDAIRALNDKVTADFKSNVETKGLAKATDIASEAMRKGRIKIDESASAARLNKDEVKRMQDRMLKTPSELRTQVKTPGLTTAQTNVDLLNDKVKGLKDQKVLIDILTSSNYREVKKKFDMAFPQSRAAGGPIQNVSGHGVKGVDTEPVLAAVGEHMWTDKEVDAVGGHQAMYQLRRDALAGRLKGHKQGGPIGLTITEQTRSKTNVPLPDPLAMAARMGGYVGEAMTDQFQRAFNDWAKANATGLGPTDVANARGLTTFRGGTFSNLFAANLRQAEKIAKMSLNIYQGGFRPATSYSGTSHQGDALDNQPVPAMIRALRAVGIASGDRTGLGNWMPHAHGVPTPGHGYAAGSAVWQAQDYLRRGGPKQSLGSPWGLWAGTSYASPGGHEVAENGSELVVNRQFRNFGRGGQMVLDNRETEQLFADANRGKGWTGSPLIGEYHQHFPQSVDPMSAAAMAGSMTVAKLRASNVGG